MYHPVHTSSIADRYVDRLLSGDTAKINRRQLISNIDGRLMAKSIVDGRLKKKKKRKRRKKKKYMVVVLACVLPASRRRPRCQGVARETNKKEM
ncbi:hypothetical protein GW17_00011505 [Ensete ventricosum]|nr:hypothetical protein GW17_00011505 [Ensete ventricosum]